MESSDLVLKSVTDAYVSSIQSISQGYFNLQILDADCGALTDTCKNCQTRLKEYLSSHKNINPESLFQVCDQACSCKFDDIDMTSVNKLNLSAFSTVVSKENFTKKVTNNMYMYADQSGTSFFMNGERGDKMTKNIENLYDTISQSNSQEAIQELCDIQYLNLRGSGLRRISVKQTSDIVSKVMLENKSISDSMFELTKTMTVIMTEIVNSAMNELIKLIVKIIMLVIIFILVLYFMNTAFNFFTLYAE